MLLPFRPSSDTVTARTFIRNYFSQSQKRGSPFAGDDLAQELRLTDPMVSSIIPDTLHDRGSYAMCFFRSCAV